MNNFTEDIALNEGASVDQIPEECLAPVERYENAVRKSVLYSQIVQDKLLEFTGIEALRLVMLVMQLVCKLFCMPKSFIES